MPCLPPLRLTHAKTLLDGTLVDHPLTIADGKITDGPAREIDLTGYLLLPGIIDLHGDGFERHVSPRPSAPFEPKGALASAAAELAANGITTAWFAQSWSWGRRFPLRCGLRGAVAGASSGARRIACRCADADQAGNPCH